MRARRFLHGWRGDVHLRKPAGFVDLYGLKGYENLHQRNNRCFKNRLFSYSASCPKKEDIWISKTCVIIPFHCRWCFNATTHSNGAKEKSRFSFDRTCERPPKVCLKRHRVPSPRCVCPVHVACPFSACPPSYDTSIWEKVHAMKDTELCKNIPAKFQESPSKCPPAANPKIALWLNISASHSQNLTGIFLHLVALARRPF